MNLTMNPVRKTLQVAVVSVSLIGMAACTSGAGPKEQVGTVLGAGGGAAIGSQIGQGKGQMVAIAVGTLLGAMAGGEIGRSLDRADRAAMSQATNQALETHQSGQAAEWSNPDSGHYGTVTPQPAYKNASGQYCREFQQEVVIDGRTESAYGTACRQPDGSWQIVQG